MSIVVHQTPSRDAWLALRRQNINSSEVAALWGWSPYMSAFTLWAVKAGVMDEPIIESERVDAGTFLEDGIAALAAHKYGWESRPWKDYVEDTEAKMGSSFDYRIEKWVEAPEDGFGLNEVKNVDYLQFAGHDRKWDGDDEDNVLAPRHIEIQAQHQMMMSGASYAVITVLVGGNELYRCIRLPNADMHAKIRAKVAKFWESIQAWRADGCPEQWEVYAPAPDYSKDAEAVMQMFRRPNPWTTIPADRQALLEPLCSKFVVARDARLAAAEEEKALKAEIVATCGGIVTEGKLQDGTKISWSPSKAGAWTLRVSPPKETV